MTENNRILSSMARAFTETSYDKITPPKVATVYRIASRTILLPELTEKWFAELIHGSIDAAIYSAGCLLQNDENEPSKRLLDEIESNYTPSQIRGLLIEGIAGISIDQISKLFELDKKPKRKKSATPTRADSVIHRQIGTFIKHFGFSEHEAKFKMTWQNYLLYMNSIPGDGTDDESDELGKNKFVHAPEFFIDKNGVEHAYKVPTMHAADFF